MKEPPRKVFLYDHSSKGDWSFVKGVSDKTNPDLEEYHHSEVLADIRAYIIDEIRFWRHRDHKACLAAINCYRMVQRATED